jgi:hypothetical protein
VIIFISPLCFVIIFISPLCFVIIFSLHYETW